jgi:hypothetical protein
VNLQTLNEKEKKKEKKGSAQKKQKNLFLVWYPIEKVNLND